MLCAGLLFVTASKGWRCAAARATCARVRAHCCAALRPVFCSPRRCAAAAFAMATSPRPHIGSNDDDDSQPQSAHRRAATKRRSVAGGGGERCAPTHTHTKSGDRSAEEIHPPSIPRPREPFRAVPWSKAILFRSSSKQKACSQSARDAARDQRLDDLRARRGLRFGRSHPAGRHGIRIPPAAARFGRGHLCSISSAAGGDPRELRRGENSRVTRALRFERRW